MEISIHQIYFRRFHRKFLEAAFAPLDNRGITPSWFEYDVMKKYFQLASLGTNELRGFVSWKFRQKTAVTGEEFVRFIQGHPGYDVYFINPFPVLESAQNVWLVGEYTHPGLLEIGNQLLNRLGWKVDLKSFVQRPEEIAFANYWVGNAYFWNLYMAAVEPMVDYIDTNQDPVLTRYINQFHHASNDRVCTLRPFLLERMFSTILTLSNQNPHYPKIRALAHPNGAVPVRPSFHEEMGLLKERVLNNTNSTELPELSRLTHSLIEWFKLGGAAQIRESRSKPSREGLRRRLKWFA